MATRMIRQDQYKLIYYPTGNRFQLFDLDSDPQEMTDLSASESHAALLQSLTALLVDELYGNDEEWLQEGQLVGLPQKEWQPVKNRELSGQRGLHWPPPPLGSVWPPSRYARMTAGESREGDDLEESAGPL